MEPDDDLPIPGGVPVPPLPYSNEPPAPPLVHRLKSIFSDWRYPAALAAAMLITSVVIAQLITVRGYVEVLDRLEDRARINDARATAAECVDQLEATFDRLIVDLVLAGDEDPTNDPEAPLADIRVELREVTAAEAVEACYDLEDLAVARDSNPDEDP